MKKLLLILSCSIASLMMGSHVNAQQRCGTVADEQTIQYMQRKVEQGGWDLPQIGRGGLPQICVPIKCHIVRFSDGSGGIPEDRVDLAISDLNNHVADINMEFFRLGDFIFIDDDSFAIVPDNEFQRDLLRQQGPVEGTLNVWFVPELTGLCGQSSFTFSDAQGILMDNDCTATGSDRATFSHEVGHYFNLFHTFETALGTECVGGSNCDSAGDLICDTPADFGRTCENGSTAVNASCELVCTTESDLCGSGEFYDPPIRNFMSYTRQRCTTEFTAEQLARFRAVAVDERANPAIDGYIDYPDCLVADNGACCNRDDGICFDVVNSGLCTLINSNNTFMGAGTSCNSLQWETCKVPDGGQGACCIGAGCLLVDGYAECLSLSGIYFGNDSDCSVAACDAIPGGCCLLDDCEIISEDLCALIDGAFLGSNSVCSSAACATVTPYVPVPPYNFPQTGPEDLDPDGYAGNAVDLDESLLLIGAMGEASNGLTNSGAAFIFDLAVPGAQLKSLKPSVAYQAAGDFFGGAVDLDYSDGSGAAIVGAYRHDYAGTPSVTDAGMAFVYDSSSWSSGSTTESYVIENPSQYRAPFDYFGFDVAIGKPSSGITAIIGAPRANVGGPDTGAVYWSSAPRITTRLDLQGLFGSSAPGSFDYCGESVAMCVTAGSAWAAMGAPGYDTDGNFKSGSVYLVKQRRGPVIGPGQLRLDPYLIPNHSPENFKQFGRSVDLYDDNGTPYLIVGALIRESSNDTGTQGSGIAFVYKYSSLGDKWTRMNPALVPLDTQPLYDNCAKSVSLTRHDGDLLAVIGCPSANVGTLVSPGLVFLYAEDGGEWAYVKEIIASDRQAGDSFGFALAIDDRIAIGAPNAGSGSTGRIYVNPVPSVDSSSGRNTNRSSEEPRDPADLGSDTKGIGHADGVIGLADVRAVIDVWGDCDHGCDYLDCHGDLNGDCRVDSADLLIVLSKWND